MNAQEYRARKNVGEERPTFCFRCLHPSVTCYCHALRPFNPQITFVILIHHREAQKRLATGRLAHLSLHHSLLLNGYDYSHHPKVNELIADPSLCPVVLYPGPGALNVSDLPPETRMELFPQEKKLVIFVIDGTWITARKTMQRSENLRALPKICFNPSRPSNFRVRKQPRPEFFSTVEAIHETIELLGPTRGFPVESRRHDALLHAFDAMVNQHLALTAERLAAGAPPRRGQIRTATLATIYPSSQTSPPPGPANPRG